MSEATIRQVVILAGGRGTRLGKITETTPKPIIPVAGKPYLEWQIELLRGHGFTNFLLLTGYLAEQIEVYFGDGSRWDVQISYSREPKPLGTAAALRLAKPKLQERFLLMNGDTYFPMNYAAFLEEAKSALDAAWIVAVLRETLAKNAPKGNVNVVETEHRVTEYVRGGRADLPFVHAGLLLTPKRLLSLMATQEGLAVEAALYPALIEKGLLRAYVCRERFYDMGTPEELSVLEEVLQSRRHQRGVVHP